MVFFIIIIICTWYSLENVWCHLLLRGLVENQAFAVLYLKKASFAASVRSKVTGEKQRAKPKVEGYFVGSFFSFYFIRRSAVGFPPLHVHLPPDCRRVRSNHSFSGNTYRTYLLFPLLKTLLHCAHIFIIDTLMVPCRVHCVPCVNVYVSHSLHLPPRHCCISLVDDYDHYDFPFFSLLFYFSTQEQFFFSSSSHYYFQSSVIFFLSFFFFSLILLHFLSYYIRQIRDAAVATTISGSGAFWSPWRPPFLVLPLLSQ